MASPATLAIRKRQQSLAPGVAVVVAHPGLSRSQRRHMLAGPAGAQRTVNIPKAARVATSNRPYLTPTAVTAPGLSRRARRLAARRAS